MVFINKIGIIVSVLFTVIAFSSAVRAEENGENSNPDRFMLRLGGYSALNAKNLIRADSNDQPVGAYIDFEDTLGGDTSATVFRLDSRFRFTDSHAIGFSWYNIQFDGNRELEQDISWVGEIIPEGTEIDSELKYNIFKLNYQYSLFHNNIIEVGVIAGFHILQTSLTVTRDDINKKSASDSTKPLPIIGLFAEYSFFRDLAAYYNYQVFFINYDDKVRGTMQDFILGLEYRAFRNVALGAAINKYTLGIEVEKPDTTVYVDSNWSGVMLYASVYF